MGEVWDCSSFTKERRISAVKACLDHSVARSASLSKLYDLVYGCQLPNFSEKVSATSTRQLSKSPSKGNFASNQYSMMTMGVFPTKDLDGI
jgi:hypothetical protein